MDLDRVLQFVARVLTLLLVIPIHESAHALVARWFGDDTAERAGRISLNPMDHFDPIGTILMILTGFGWAKPVPINPVRMKKFRAGIALTALAGPVSNILAAFVGALAYAIVLCTETGYEASTSSAITPMSCVILLIRYFFSVNIGLAVFNMIPLPPLDGYNVLSYFTSAKVDRWFHQHQREVSMAFFIVIISINFLPSWINPLYYARSFIGDLLWTCVKWIPKLRWGY
ncbi:MAG: site-2 protease family protein [Ruminococcus sp.]|nr:site-2 protease family protein [Ruminococcus sp.]